MNDSGEYVPTTQDVRAVYIARGEPITPGTAKKHDLRAEAFDRWLTANNAAVREAAQREVVDYLASEVEFHDLNDARTHFNLNQTGVTDDAQ